MGPVIARGGMSTVYRGVDTRLDRPVAIKIMEPRLAADPAFRIRFEREARSAARIDHPAVVDVHDQGQDIGGGGSAEAPVLFLVMELVEGGTLRDVLRARGPLGVPAALAVMEQVLAGLAEAHRLGMVHRDVKPENVLISHAREVKVADFGLVVAAAEAGASHVGVIMGTVAYLSPEQVATGTADPRSDVYAAGVLLYELLTGEPPYRGETAISVAYRHVNSDVPAPSLIAGDVPPELDALVQRATRRDPAARPADAGAMLAELRAVAQRLAVPRVPPPAPPRGPVGVQAAAHATGHSAPLPAALPAPHGTAVLDAGPRGTRALPRATGSLRVAEAVQPPPHLRARRRSRRLLAVGIAVVVILMLVVAGAAWWLGTGRWTAMPTLVGLERTAAERILADADLVPSSTLHVDDSIAAGFVTVTDPAPDARLLRGSRVALMISTGPPIVPAIARGTAVAAAEQAIRDASLEPVRDTSAAEFSSSVPTGAVIRTDPAAGTTLTTGAPVTLVVSRGAEPKEPEQVRVPMVIGKKFDQAAKILSDAGLKAQERNVLPFGRGNGRVVGQDRGFGSSVDPGTTITLDTL